jgi:predicted ATPase
MLKKLWIKNYKLWENTNWIDMAPMTLFFGVNSSGKSSIGQLLMLLKQTIDSSDRLSGIHSVDLFEASGFEKKIALRCKGL